ncbi:unnamed protein product, partial [Effrenium voratum]
MSLFRAARPQLARLARRPALRLSPARLGVGAGALLLACAATPAPAFFGRLKCEEKPPPESKLCESKPSESLLRSTARITSALLCWGFFASIWFVSITLPAGLLWAVTAAKWKLVSSILAAYAFPHVVTLPPLPLAVRRAFFSGLESWFPEGIQVVRPNGDEPEPEPPAKRPQLFCIHPHGIYTLGALTLPEKVPEVKVCIAAYLYNWAPCFRVMAQLLGISLGSVDPGALKQLMQRQESPLALVPGGFEEATVSCRNTERVYLKSRAGFIKYALRHGYDVVPCFTVGDSDMFSNPQGAWRFRWWLNQLSIPAVLPFGFPLLPLLPKRVPVKLAIGEALEMPHIANPSRAEVEKHRAR